MKITFHLLVASFVAVLFYTASFAQKANVTDAALLMKKYNPMAGLDASKKIITKAKCGWRSRRQHGRQAACS